ncbi:helix-turn-helix transcriptional regulator [Streptomyces sp. MMBL 11-1]|uniref:helix-turn-helix transcriptional regulator n=1 Tax=Streptomyces sp. MMBL 11-1 TaxID=3026420 RepID=UPI00235FF4EE|nr:helix-turn-helix domain-containing protein [Streptomyces sp. MMBL 11-1]
MKRHRDESVAFSAVFGLPAEMGMRMAADALSLSLSTAYKRARNGEFPCPVRRIGRRYVVRMADLMRTLGIQDVRVHYDDFETGARIARARSDTWY